MPALLLWIGTVLIAAGSPLESAWWDKPVNASLDRARRKAEWVRVLESCPPEHRGRVVVLAEGAAAPRPREDVPGCDGRQRRPGLPGAWGSPLGCPIARGDLPRRRPAAREPDRAPAINAPSSTTDTCRWSRTARRPARPRYG